MWVTQTGVLRTGDKARTVGRKVRHEIGHILWFSEAFNWCASDKLKTSSLIRPAEQFFLGNSLTAASAGELFPEASGAFSGSTVGAIYVGEKTLFK